VNFWILNPRRCGSCDVMTWKAAPVVKPLISESDSSEDRMPSFRKPIRSWKRGYPFRVPEVNRYPVPFICKELTGC